MSERPLAIGIDLGTSSVKAAAVAQDGTIAGFVSAPMPPREGDWPHTLRNPQAWWQGTEAALDALLRDVPAARIAALCVDGTSGTVLAVDRAGIPLAPARLYDEPVREAEFVARVEAAAPPESAAHGATSGLAKVLALQDLPGVAHLLHQADWVTGLLRGQHGTSDANNALKTGYDPVTDSWPGWIARTGARLDLLPQVVAPGTVLGALAPKLAGRFGLPAETRICAGTTDGCASFLATGAARPGEAVTALGSTLVVKLASDRPLFAPAYGLYSHRVGAIWLAGGASNTGGAALGAHFAPARMAELSARIDPRRPSGLDYYPLTKPGERFPVADPALAPRVTPRPDDDALFLQGLLEGVARVEAQAYAQLAELGGPAVASVRTVGGGARNAAWSAIRARVLGVPLVPPDADEAAVGAARLAWRGLAAA